MVEVVVSILCIVWHVNRVSFHLRHDIPACHRDTTAGLGHSNIFSSHGLVQSKPKRLSITLDSFFVQQLPEVCI